MAKHKKAATKEIPYVGIIGMGYVGLPLSREFCLGGAKVLGFDVIAQRVSNLNKAISPLKHLGNYQIRDMIRSKRFRATKTMSELSKVDAIIIDTFDQTHYMRKHSYARWQIYQTESAFKFKTGPAFESYVKRMDGYHGKKTN